MKQTIIFLSLITISTSQAMDLRETQLLTSHIEKQLLQSKKAQQIGNYILYRGMKDELSNLPQLSSDSRYGLLIAQAIEWRLKLAQNNEYREALFTALSSSYFYDCYQGKDQDAQKDWQLARHSWNQFILIAKTLLVKQTELAIKEKEPIEGKELMKAAIITQFFHLQMRNHVLKIEEATSE